MRTDYLPAFFLRVLLCDGHDCLSLCMHIYILCLFYCTVRRRVTFKIWKRSCAPKLWPSAETGTLRTIPADYVAVCSVVSRTSCVPTLLLSHAHAGTSSWWCMCLIRFHEERKPFHHQHWHTQAGAFRHLLLQHLARFPVSGNGTSGAMQNVDA